MINYEKIKLGKGLTKNQKRLRIIYLEHQMNLDENCIFHDKDMLNGHRVKIWLDDFDVKCSREIGNRYIVYDDRQKENIKLHIETQSIRNWKWHYTKYLDDVYIILGRKNILRHKSHEYFVSSKNCYMFYDNNNILRLIEPEVNHRKKEGGISLYKEFEGGL